MTNQKDNSLNNPENPEYKGGNHNLSLTLYEDDKSLFFIHKKTEKIITALYMISDFFSDEEPLKWKIREGGTNILSHINRLKSTMTSEEDSVFYLLRQEIGEIISMLEIGNSLSYVSEMNLTILKREFKNLLDTIATQKQKQKSGQSPSHAQTLFSQRFFDVSLEESPSRYSAEGEGQNQVQAQEDRDRNFSTEEQLQRQGQNEVQNGNQPQGQMSTSSRSTQVPDTAIDSFSTPLQQEYSSTVSKGQNESRMSSPQSLKRYPTSRVKVKRNRRKNDIIAFLKKRDKASIRDISKNVNGCSEKTIQRELNALIKDGVLEKEGERRWSRYSLS